MREGKKPMAVSEKYMLTIKEAAEYFNVGIKKMRRLAEDNEGEFAIYMGNRLPSLKIFSSSLKYSA